MGEPIVFQSPFAPTPCYLPACHDSGSSSFLDTPQRSARRGSALLLSSPKAQDDCKRRHSVDAGTLHHQDDIPEAKRLRTQRVSPDQDLPSEYVFSAHLTAVLAHAATLCAGSGETTVDLFARGEVSPLTTPYIDQTPSQGQDYFSTYRPKRESTIPDVIPVNRHRLVALLQNWGFNALSLPQDELWECAVLMLEAALCMEGVDASISIGQMHSLVYSLRSAYHARNGYHNFAHAVDVCQALYSFLVTLELIPPLSVLLHESLASPCAWKRPAHIQAPSALGCIIRPMDAFTLLVAAIGHDVGHPGLSNAYMINAKTSIAHVYGDKSALENFHTVTLLQILQKHGLGHLFGATHARSERRMGADCRGVLFASVLATDMARHFPILAKMQNLARSRSVRSSAKHRLRETDRLLLCSALIKCADISNPSRPHSVSKAWSTALFEEWSVQAQIEAEFELPISVMTLDPKEELAQAKSQVGFIKLFSQPLYDALAALVPAFNPYANFCYQGRRAWEVELQQPPSLYTYEGRPDINDWPVWSPIQLPKRPSALSGSRRKPPPRPLSFGSLRDRMSNSSASSAESLTPGSPVSTARMSSFSSVSSWATDITSASSFSPMLTSKGLSCTGVCLTVTAKCAACVWKEQAELARTGGSDRRRSFGSPLGVYFDGNSPNRNEIWPPLPFYPQSPHTTLPSEV